MHCRLEEDALETIVFSLCQMGYLSPLKTIIEHCSPAKRYKILRCPFPYFRDGPRPFQAGYSDWGYNPLHFACKGDTVGNIAVLKYLVEEHGIAAHGDDGGGQSTTPLHVAATYGCSNVKNYLLEQ